jgi:hypothetical protein
MLNDDWDKSHVTMEQKVCAICNKPYDTGAILLDRQLRKRFKRQTITGLGLCKECVMPGYIALVVIDESKSDASAGRVRPENIYKTGEVIHVKEDAFDKVFQNVAPELKATTFQTKFTFIDTETAEKLNDMKKGGKK